MLLTACSGLVSKFIKFWVEVFDIATWVPLEVVVAIGGTFGVAKGALVGGVAVVVADVVAVVTTAVGGV